MKKRTRIIILSILLGIILPISIVVANGGVAEIQRRLISGGGGTISGENVRLDASLGQPVVGISNEGNQSIHAGYWPGVTIITNTIYVDADAVGAATGLSWTDAYTNPQDALAVALSGDEVWVAEGVYYPDEGVGQTDNYTASTFLLPDGVAIYGGFDPDIGDDDFSERDWRTNVSVLSGDLVQDDIADSGVVTDTANITGTNAYHVVSSTNVGSNTILDGFTVTAGQANLSGPHQNGGGMHNEDSSPILRNLIFSGNYAMANGGGMINFSSNPTLTNVSFINNSAGYRGGGMANHGSSPQLTNVILRGNFGDNGGGALFNRQSDPTLVHVTVVANESGADGGGLYNWEPPYPTLINSIVWGNTAANSGDQLYDRSGAAPVVTYSDIEGGYSGTGNINIDPQFVREYDDLHLDAVTPAVDGAAPNHCPATDIDGLPRGSTCDMGACEYRYRMYFPLVTR